MKKPVILISAVCGDIGYSAVRALRDSASRIIGCDMRPFSPAADLIDSFHIAPAAADPGFSDFLLDVIRKEKVEAFLPISEPEIRVLSPLRGRFEVEGIKLLINNDQIVRTFLDKLETSRYLQSIGIPTPQTAVLKDYDGSFGFPLAVKARTGSGSRKFRRIEDEDELRLIRKKDDGSLIVQPYVGSEAEEYTTGVFSNGSSVSTITFRRRLGYGGLSVEAKLADEPYLEKLAANVADAMKLTGSINIQSRKLKDDFFMPFEINPRLSSTLLFRKKFGFDDAVWWLNTLLGKQYSYRKEYKSGIAIRYVSECYFQMEKN